MRVVALAGGIGAARFLRGLVRALPDPGADRGGHDAAQLAVVANTGDDMQLLGLHISPDLDTITYTLGGGVHPEQGWGRAGESFEVADELRDRYGRPRWFTLGDRDLATHLVRTEALRAGRTLSEATAEIAASWGLGFRLLPMTDDPVATRIRTVDGRDLHFQEWWVGERAKPEVSEVVLEGAEAARPAPGVLEAIAAADRVILCPSNPVVSIMTILAVPGIREALRHPPVVGISPIIRGGVVRGMADRLLPAVGVETSAAAVPHLYRDFLDGWIIDRGDAELEPRLLELGLAVAVTDTLMRRVAVAEEVALTALHMPLRGGG